MLIAWMEDAPLEACGGRAGPLGSLLGGIFARQRRSGSRLVGHGAGTWGALDEVSSCRR